MTHDEPKRPIGWNQRKDKREFTIKPIPTVYQNFPFRSRLEARWAVAFNEMGLPWDYETEGYEVAAGVWYLPDFLIRDEPPLHIEVKHKNDDDLAAMEKMGLLVEGLKEPGVIVYGDPYEHYAVLFVASADLPCGYVRHVVNFNNLKDWKPAAIKARQATF